MQFNAPWHEDDSETLATELRRETPPGHVLHGVPVRALARRRDCDDALFALEDGTSRVAVVHLTYAAEADPRWPDTEIFESRQAWLATR